MVSRVGFFAILLVSSRNRCFGHCRARHRLQALRCSSSSTTRGSARAPLCGGYWVVTGQRRADALRGRAAAGALLRRARAVDRYGRPYVNEIPEGSLVRGAIELGQRFGDRTLDQLRVYAVYAPAGTAAVSGGYYRVVDNGIRCIRAPCFSYRAGSGQRIVAGHDLRGSTSRRRARRQARSSGHRRRYERRTASTRAAGSRRRRTAAASFARCASTSERRSLAPEHVPGEPHVVLGRPEVADREPEHDTGRRSACARGRPRPSR